MFPVTSCAVLAEPPDAYDVESSSWTVPPGALLPHPGLLTDTHAVLVAETWPTGVSDSAKTDAVVCEDTGTGAEISAVSVAAVLAPVVATSA